MCLIKNIFLFITNYIVILVAQKDLTINIKENEKKERRKRGSTVTFDDLKVMLKEKEEAKKSRHEEKQELLRQSISSYERTMEKLLDKL